MTEMNTPQVAWFSCLAFCIMSMTSFGFTRWIFWGIATYFGLRFCYLTINRSGKN